ncbi:MAG: peptidase, partial [Gammaproteobacteria bacterium]|nr:peptidase [Gammaproteobacteria bacterium]
AYANSPFGRRLARFTVVYFRDRAYIFIGVRRDENDNRKYRTEFLNTALSLKALSPDESKLARARRIALLRAKPDTRYASVAASSGLTSYAEAQLRLLNGDYPSGEPEPGRLIKTVD